MICFIFCKQKTAYEMRTRDWSSDVCSSDLEAVGRVGAAVVAGAGQSGDRGVQVPALEAGLGVAGELVGERQRADGGEVDGAGFKRLPGHVGFEFAEGGVAGFEAAPLVELVAAERGEGGVLVVVAGFVDERLAGTAAKVEAGFFGRLRAEGGGADQGGKQGSGQHLVLAHCLDRKSTV